MPLTNVEINDAIPIGGVGHFGVGALHLNNSMRLLNWVKIRWNFF
jgi:hypothetical protein